MLIACDARKILRLVCLAKLIIGGLPKYPHSLAAEPCLAKNRIVGPLSLVTGFLLCFTLGGYSSSSYTGLTIQLSFNVISSVAPKFPTTVAHDHLHQIQVVVIPIGPATF